MFDLNTSYVKVQSLIFWPMHFYILHLNTSYVKVQSTIQHKKIGQVQYLNTSYVKVQSNNSAETTPANIFKYILC